MKLLSIIPLASVVTAAVAISNPVSDQLPLTPSTLWQIPTLGFGTWNIKDNATEAVSYAIKAGYRHIDCAAIYGNEKSVGKGIAKGLKEAGISRAEIWVTSKLWNDHHAPKDVEKALDKTLSDLGLDYLDLYHMHWPVASSKKHGNNIYFVETWDAMSQLAQTGKTRHVGISNFSPAQLDTLLNSTTHIPYAHQMELHPYLQQEDWIAYHKARGIHVTAYSPLGGTNPTYGGSKHAPTPLLEDKDMTKIAGKHDASAAQVALAWGMSRGISVIPKSVHARWIDENFASKEIKLDADDHDIIAKLGHEHTFRYNNPSKSWGVNLYEGLEGV